MTAWCEAIIENRKLELKEEELKIHEQNIFASKVNGLLNLWGSLNLHILYVLHANPTVSVFTFTRGQDKTA